MATAGKIDPEANDPLVEVFGSERESEVLVVKGLLESAGIDCMTRNFDAPQDILPGVGGVAVLVRADQAEEARSIIEQNSANGPADAEAAESESEGLTEEPTA